MDKNNLYANLKSKMYEIVSAIDLNYILAEAKRYGYRVCLVYGDLEQHVKWSSNATYLSHNYELSVGILYHFLSLHSDKIIKINITSDDDIFPLNRNMIIHVPYQFDIDKIKKEYKSIVGINQ